MVDIHGILKQLAEGGDIMILFLVMVFGFVIGTFTFNIYRLTKAYRHGQEIRSATEMQDSLLKERHKEPVAPIVEPTQTRQQ